LRGSFGECGSPGRLGRFEGSIFKGAGPDHPHVTEDEPTGKEAGLAEQRPLAGSQEQKESLWSLEEWASYLR